MYSRARSGQTVTETETEVILGQAAVISVEETGAIANTANRTTIKCQASGKPRPNIQLNLFVPFGPDLTQTGLYQVFLSQHGNYNNVFVCLRLYVPVKNFSVIFGQLPGFNQY